MYSDIQIINKKTHLSIMQNEKFLETLKKLLLAFIRQYTIKYYFSILYLFPPTLKYAVYDFEVTSSGTLCNRYTSKDFNG